MGRRVRRAVGDDARPVAPAHLFADQPVQQRGLARVRGPHDRRLQRPRVLGLVLGRRQVDHPARGSCQAGAERAPLKPISMRCEAGSKALSADVPGSWYGRGVRRTRWIGVGASPSAPAACSTGSRRGGADSTKAARTSRGNCLDRMLMGRLGAATAAAAHAEAGHWSRRSRPAPAALDKHQPPMYRAAAALR